MYNAVKAEFTDIYAFNKWGGGSGCGSYPASNKEYSKVLIDFIKNKNIKSILDYGCGDWQFSRYIPWSDIVEKYIGCDVVDNIIQHNQNTFASQWVQFQLVDEAWQFPDVDLIICKDVLQHLPNNLIGELISKMQQHSKYILITNDINGDNINDDCIIGGYRPLDLTKEPWLYDVEILGNFLYENTWLKQTILLKND